MGASLSVWLYYIQSDDRPVKGYCLTRSIHPNVIDRPGRGQIPAGSTSVSRFYCHKLEKRLSLALRIPKGALYASRWNHWDRLLYSGKGPYKLRSGKDGGDQ